MSDTSEIWYYRVSRRELVYLKFILEAYEGMSVMSTVDRHEGVVAITVPLPFRVDMANLLGALQTEIDLKPLPGYEPAAEE